MTSAPKKRWEGPDKKTFAGEKEGCDDLGKKTNRSTAGIEGKKGAAPGEKIIFKL